MGNDERENVYYTCQKMNGASLLVGLIVRSKYHNSCYYYMQQNLLVNIFMYLSIILSSNPQHSVVNIECYGHFTCLVCAIRTTSKKILV